MSLELELDEASDMTLSLVDVNGKTLMTINKRIIESGEQVVDFELESSISNGLYYIKIEVNGLSEMKPLIVQR